VELSARDRVQIESAKVRDYLLCKAHPVGRFKAAFFEALGYSAAEWPQLESDLRQLAMTGDATFGKHTKLWSALRDPWYSSRGIGQGRSGDDDLDCSI